MINKKKIAAAMMTGALVLSAFAGPVAAYDHNDSDNGSRSDNDYSYREEKNVTVNQDNNADFSNNISIRSNTGGNRSDDNWRNHTESGDSDVSARVSNFANMNHANIGGSNRNWDTGDLSKNHDRNKDNRDDDNARKDHHDADKHGDTNNHGHDKDTHDDHDSSKDHHDDTDHKHEFSASMSGSEEVPGPGDSDASGHFKSTASHENNTLCVEMHVQNIELATAAHIHYGNKGEAGPAVVQLPTPDANGHASGCINVESDLLWKITENPSHYYINVHNASYPDGALRGQLN